MMKTVQVTLDETLVSAVDEAARKLNLSRSAFTRKALRTALKRVRDESEEQRHRAGYVRKPVKKGEFDIWEDEQVWGE